MGRLNDINLDLVPGEVVGLGGLDGQGQRHLLLALFGTLVGVTGTVEIDGKPVKLSNPKRCKVPDIGMALIPEDRKNEGLMLPDVGARQSLVRRDRRISAASASSTPMPRRPPSMTSSSCCRSSRTASTGRLRRCRAAISRRW